MQAELADREELLDEVVTSYLRAVGAGQTPDRGELLARYPDLAADLNEFFADQDQVQELAAPLRSIAPAPGATGQTFGDFEAGEEIGRGGMGIVYKARQKSLNRIVALKVLPLAATMDSRQLRRFHNEAQAAAGLHHTNIVPVYFVGSERGVHYYAMQFIDGRDLASVIAQFRAQAGRKPHDPQTAETVDAAACEPAVHSALDTPPLAYLSTEDSTKTREYFRAAAQLGIQAAEALDHAHQMGIVHRDIKPANLLVSADGRLWVTDFGLAQMQTDTRLTMTGDLVGTLRYMSPEQALAKRVVIDHRTDVYSLGATLYELLTLEPAFGGNDREELLRQIAFEEPRRPRRSNRAIPRELETIVLKSLERNPADRYGTAQELADDLRRFLEDRPIQARRPTLGQRAAKWARRHKAVVNAVGVVLLLFVAGLTAGTILLTSAYQREAKEHQHAVEAKKAEADQREWAEKGWGEAAKQLAIAQGQREQARANLRDALRLANYLNLVLTNESRPPEVSSGAALASDAVAVLQKAVADEPGNADYRRQLVQRLYESSAFLAANGQLSAAAAAMRRAVDTLDNFPTDRELQAVLPYHRATVRGELGQLLRATGNYDEGERVYAQALDLAQKQLKRKPSSHSFWETVRLHNEMGLLRLDAGRLDEAEQSFVAALTLLKEPSPFDKEPGARSFLLVERGRARGGLGNVLLETGKREEAVREFRDAREDYERMLAANSGVGDAARLYLWSVYTCPVAEVAVPERALALASSELEGASQGKDAARTAECKKLAGLAHYRAGDWRASRNALAQFQEHRAPDSWVWFVRAMAEWQLGEREAARMSFDAGARWMQENRPADLDLRRLRAEAAALIGIKDAPPADRKKEPITKP
jgi:serine/threonine protein kinase